MFCFFGNVDIKLHELKGEKKNKIEQKNNTYLESTNKSGDFNVLQYFKDRAKIYMSQNFQLTTGIQACATELLKAGLHTFPKATAEEINRLSRQYKAISILTIHNLVENEVFVVDICEFITLII